MNVKDQTCIENKIWSLATLCTGLKFSLNAYEFWRFMVIKVTQNNAVWQCLLAKYI